MGEQHDGSVIEFARDVALDRLYEPVERLAIQRVRLGAHRSSAFHQPAFALRSAGR